MTAPKHYRRLRVALGALVLVLAAPLAAWAVNPNTDPAYWMIRVKGVFSKWPAAKVPVPLEVSWNYLCGDVGCTQQPLIDAAANNAAARWNDVFVNEGIVANSFFQNCDSASPPGTCSLPRFKPAIPDTTLGDQAGNLINLETSEANHTCVFPAYHVSSVDGPLSAYVEYTQYNPSTGQPTAWNEFPNDPEERAVVVTSVLNSTDYTVTIDGTAYTTTSDANGTMAEVMAALVVCIKTGTAGAASCKTATTPATIVTAINDGTRLLLTPETPGAAFTLSVGANLAAQGPATKLCSLWVEHTINTVSPGPDPDQFLPGRNANGSIKVTGDGANRVFVEESDFLNATGGIGTSGVLALTLSWAYPGQIVEADVIVNNTERLSRLWGVGAVPPGDCAVPALQSDGATDGTLCYRGDTTYTNAPAIFLLQNVLTHELGHFVGLDHPCARYDSTPLDRTDLTAGESDCRAAADPTGGTQTKISTTTMFYAANPGQTNKETIEEPDVDGVRYLYLPRGGGGGCALSPGGGDPAGGAFLLAGFLGLAAFFRRRRAGAGRGRRPLRRVLVFAIFGGAALLGALGEARATSVEAQSSRGLARSADTVSQVRVKSVQTQVLPSGFPVQVYELEAGDTLKGAAPARLTVPGGTVGGKTLFVAGAPSFAIGEELLLFTQADKAGRHFVDGFMQGAKRVVRDKTTGKARVRTEEPVAGGVLEAAPGGQVKGLAAAGPPELPPEMDLDDYKAFLRKALAE